MEDREHIVGSADHGRRERAGGRGRVRTLAHEGHPAVQPVHQLRCQLHILRGFDR